MSPCNGAAWPGELLDPQPGDAARAAWTLECTVKPLPAGVDLLGPYVQGGPGARFVYLSWIASGRTDGVAAGPEGFTMFRRAKLMLAAVDPDTADAAVRGGTLVARLGLTDVKGHPLCAAVRPPLVAWSAEYGRGRRVTAGAGTWRRAPPGAGPFAYRAGCERCLLRGATGTAWCLPVLLGAYWYRVVTVAPLKPCWA